MRRATLIYLLYAFLMDKSGISLLELATLVSIWSIVVVASEVQSGALTDRFSGKYWIIASGALKSAAFLSWYLESVF